MQAGEDLQQGRLAAAGRADDRDELAVGDGEVDVAQRRDGVGPAAVALRQMADRDGVAGGARAPARRPISPAWLRARPPGVPHGRRVGCRHPLAADASCLGLGYCETATRSTEAGATNGAPDERRVDDL